MKDKRIRRWIPASGPDWICLVIIVVYLCLLVLWLR